MGLTEAFSSRTAEKRLRKRRDLDRMVAKIHKRRKNGFFNRSAAVLNVGNGDLTESVVSDAYLFCLFIIVLKISEINFLKKLHNRKICVKKIIFNGIKCYKNV